MLRRGQRSSTLADAQMRRVDRSVVELRDKLQALMTQAGNNCSIYRYGIILEAFRVRDLRRVWVRKIAEGNHVSGYMKDSRRR